MEILRGKKQKLLFPLIFLPYCNTNVKKGDILKGKKKHLMIIYLSNSHPLDLHILDVIPSFSRPAK